MKKEQKKLAKVEAAQTSSGDVEMEEDEEEEAPFDYSKAESVLHSKRSGGEKGGKQRKPFDPYAKSSDAPKGLRRLQTERPGKSQTFKK